MEALKVVPVIIDELVLASHVWLDLGINFRSERQAS